MSKYVKADFYLVEKIDDSDPNFEVSLKEISRIPHRTSERNILYNDTPIRMDSISKTTNDNWIGDIIKIRMDNIPPKASMTGQISPIALNDDEGLGEETAFLYIPNRKVLIIQKNWHGISPNLLCKYVHAKTEEQVHYRLKPIIKKEALERLKKMKSIRKIKISYADIKNPEMIIDANDGIGSAISKIRDYDAVNAEITISVGHSKKELKKPKLLQTFEKIMQNPADRNVRKIEVSGKDENEDNSILDLLEDRITFGEELESNSNRNIKRVTRFNFLKRAWNEKRREIRELIED